MHAAVAVAAAAAAGAAAATAAGAAVAVAVAVAAGAVAARGLGARRDAALAGGGGLGDRPAAPGWLVIDDLDRVVHPGTDVFRLGRACRHHVVDSAIGNGPMLVFVGGGRSHDRIFFRHRRVASSIWFSGNL